MTATQTVKQYGDVELYVDWCIEAGADSGVYLKNAPQIQMWSNPLGSGGLFNNKVGAKNPLVVADNPADHWNTFRIIQRNGDMTTVWLNGQLVVNKRPRGRPPKHPRPILVVDEDRRVTELALGGAQVYDGRRVLDGDSGELIGIQVA